MFDLADSFDVVLTPEKILVHVSELEIFKRYCTPFKELDKSFCSELRKDRSPDCRIFVTNSNTIRYKDFATGDNLNCWQYVMNKYTVKFGEALRIIYNDFNLDKERKISGDSTLIGRIPDISLNNTPPTKSEIIIVSQPFNLTDYEYWTGNYHVPLELLEEYNVFSAKIVYLYKNNILKNTFYYSKSNPCYAYRFTRDGKYYYKIYWPLNADKKYKFLFCGSMEDIEGYDQLPLWGDLLIISKSMKDILALKVLGYNAISLQGEANRLNHDTYNKLYNRFGKIISFFDPDPTGIKGAQYHKETYKIDSIFIPDKYACKDISDFIKKYGIKKAKNLVRNLINGTRSLVGY